jgi:hypothetical protein
MEQILLSSLPVWAMHLVLGGAVYLREPRQASHQAFAACVLAIVLWSIMDIQPVICQSLTNSLTETCRQLMPLCHLLETTCTVVEQAAPGDPSLVIA